MRQMLRTPPLMRMMHTIPALNKAPLGRNVPRWEPLPRRTVLGHRRRNRLAMQLKRLE